MKSRLILMLSCALLLFNCGGGGGPGAPGSSNTSKVGATIAVSSGAHSSPAGDFGDSWQIDLTQNCCATDDTGACTTYEGWGDDSAGLTVSVIPYDETNLPGQVYLTRYTVEYTPQALEVDVPPIAKLDESAYVTILAPVSLEGSSNTLNSIIFDAGAKTEYMTSIDNGTYNPSSREPYHYDMKITVYGVDMYGTEFSVVFHRSAQVGQYNYCG